MRFPVLNDDGSLHVNQLADQFSLLDFGHRFASAQEFVSPEPSTWKQRSNTLRICYHKQPSPKFHLRQRPHASVRVHANQTLIVTVRVGRLPSG